MPHDNAFLLTDTKFDNGVVGKALLKTMCSSSGSVGLAVDHDKNVAVVATTIAHELGHNLGMKHDEENCRCPGRSYSGCIMSPVSIATSPTHWSSCSIDQLNEALNDGVDYCLKNRPENLFDSPTCGNGFVEPGEQCDCGLEEHCDNPCCNPKTCRFASKATCATGSCCDLSACKPYVKGEWK